MVATGSVRRVATKLNARYWRGLVDTYYVLDFEMAGRNKHHFSQYATVKRGDRVELAHAPRS